MLAALPADIKPIVVSYPADQKISYPNLVPLIMAALPIDEPFILLGESFSGPLAVMVAATRPANLIGVILCATFVNSPRPLLAWAIQLFARPILFRTFPPAQFIKAIIGGNATPELLALVAQVHASFRPEVIAFRVRMVSKVDVRNQLHLCDTPMLYIAAANDKIVPARNIQIIQQIKSDLQVVTIHAPHAIPLTRPVQTAEFIKNFAMSLVRLQSQG